MFERKNEIHPRAGYGSYQYTSGCLYLDFVQKADAFTLKGSERYSYNLVAHRLNV